MSGEDVSNWFEDSTLSRMVERRTRGVTADWLLSELVRRPGEANRNSATSLTRREENQTTDRRGKASGTGPLIAFKIPTTAVIPPTCSTTAGGKSAPGSSRKPLRRPTSARCAFMALPYRRLLTSSFVFGIGAMTDGGTGRRTMIGYWTALNSPIRTLGQSMTVGCSSSHHGRGQSPIHMPGEAPRRPVDAGITGGWRGPLQAVLRDVTEQSPASTSS